MKGRSSKRSISKDFEVGNGVTYMGNTNGFLLLENISFLRMLL